MSLTALTYYYAQEDNNGVQKFLQGLFNIRTGGTSLVLIIDFAVNRFCPQNIIPFCQKCDIRTVKIGSGY